MGTGNLSRHLHIKLRWKWKTMSSCDAVCFTTQLKFTSLSWSVGVSVRLLTAQKNPLLVLLTAVMLSGGFTTTPARTQVKSISGGVKWSARHSILLGLWITATLEGMEREGGAGREAQNSVIRWICYNGETSIHSKKYSQYTYCISKTETIKDCRLITGLFCWKCNVTFTFPHNGQRSNQCKSRTYLKCIVLHWLNTAECGCSWCYTHIPPACWLRGYAESMRKPHFQGLQPPSWTPLQCDCHLLQKMLLLIHCGAS